MVGKQSLTLGIHNENLHPVATCRGERVGKELSVLAECGGVERNGAILREGIRIEEYLLLGICKVAFAVDYALILQSAVAREVVPIAVLRRSALCRVVPQLRKACLDLLARWQRVEVVECNLVLLLNPSGCSLGIVILQPTIRVGNLGAEIVVHNLLSDSLWIFDTLCKHTL